MSRTSACGSCQRRLQRTNDLDGHNHTQLNASEHDTTFSWEGSETMDQDIITDTCSCEPQSGRKGKPRDRESKEKDQGTDWKALYQLTSNWYRGRARGYCPSMLPSLTTLASATQVLSEIGIISSTSSHKPSEQQPSNPVQRAIKKTLQGRKPAAVVGLQFEGSSLTELSLAKVPPLNLGLRRDIRAGEGATSYGRGTQIALVRSNPHYRVRRDTAGAIDNQPNIGNITVSDQQAPNIMVQDPCDHSRVTFAVRPSSQISNSQDEGTLETLPVNAPQNTAPHDSQGATLSSAAVGMAISEEPANDILSHFSSPLHTFLVTGHMDGGVRLWDMSIQEPGQQCIRHWQTGVRRRVLCVGMNSQVVVSGSDDSTLSVWDIHPNPGSSLSSHGTIHVASYLTATPHTGINRWLCGIDSLCVGDSLVACTTEISASVLIFSLATGSLVYEMPGAHIPTKMCMTDFFLLTAGYSTFNSNGMRVDPRQPANRSTTHLHGDDDEDEEQPRQQQEDTTMEGEYMSCCVDIWDLKTGDRLYSLIPRLPSQPHQTKNIATIPGIPLLTDVGEASHAKPILRAGDTTMVYANTEANTQSPVSSLSPAPAPLTLLAMTVTPDHSTLVVALREESGQGRDGVYCWDFSGSRLETYHEQGSEIPTMIIDRGDLEYSDDQGSGSIDTEDGVVSGDQRADEEGYESEVDDRFNNSLVMQQVDSTVFRNMHQARVTGKVWIGWQLDKQELLEGKRASRRERPQ